MIALQKIGKRAKQLRAANKKLSQRDAVKKAAAEYRAGKLGKVPKKKAPVKQYGSSDKKRDQERAARAPGWRKSKSGSKYYERRKNRSDVKGKLTGTTRITSQIQAEIDQIRIAENMIAGYVAIKKAGLTSSQKAQIKRDKAYWMKVKQAHKKNLSNLKTLI